MTGVHKHEAAQNPTVQLLSVRGLVLYCALPEGLEGRLLPGQCCMVKIVDDEEGGNVCLGQPSRCLVPVINMIGVKRLRLTDLRHLRSEDNQPFLRLLVGLELSEACLDRLCKLLRVLGAFLVEQIFRLLTSLLCLDVVLLSDNRAQLIPKLDKV